MNLSELKADLDAKTVNFEQSIIGRKPHAELLEIYKEMKRLRYEILQEEMKTEPNDDSTRK